ncbi:MAG: DUF839 domain-containing protein [Verrucomicrobia bacterium]|nr:MAG: DUF839 domain-containing protein [Verrucomicrobiota bacterium]TAE88168.1 MAG: DUF839 domain-containing protein [Verrucomicrobiota bacterium]TAF26052.1 MAG: DUF839 domain-containing protein [Verrucomicrobiota bacterium]TAF41023.1 MAG: DUF839 domain-containing protein [Verrucomicrobiota bacterium]
MKLHSIRKQLLMTAGLIATQSAMAGTDVWFTPLTQSAPVVAPNAVEELSSPWVTPAGITQNNWVSLREIEDQVLSPGQSIVRVPGQNTSASMFDMLAYNPEGTHVFIPHETPIGAGCTRYDIFSNKAEVIFAGDQKGGATPSDWTNDFGAFDPCRWTPNNTLFLAEEWAGLGRVVEILNPMAPTAEIESRIVESIANVSHEGINFSQKFKDTIYYIDEWNSGSIYKFVMKTPGDYSVGQTFVLSVDDFLASGGVPAANYNEGANATATREGIATWIPLTDANGVALPGITNPFRDGPTNDPRTNSNTMGGRPAADDAGGTPFGRPEDMIVSRNSSGNEMLYVAVTSESKVISIEILGKVKPTGKAIVRTMASESGTPKNLGFAATTGVLNSPDNLSMDAAGNVYVIEDSPNSSSTGGDIWFIRDKNSDGVAESLDHFISIRVNGSEATGMIFNPAVPTEFVVAVQHPSSTNLTSVPNGIGDAVWSFNVSGAPNAKGYLKALAKGRFNTNQ